MLGVTVHVVTTVNVICELKGDQQSSWFEAGGRDTALLSPAHRQHRTHLSYVLPHIRNSRRAGE